MKFKSDLENWQLTGIISFILFLFSLSNKISIDEGYVVEVYYNIYERLSRMFYEYAGNNFIVYSFEINVVSLLFISIIFMLYFILRDNIYLYSIWSFIFSIMVLSYISNAFMAFENSNLRLGFYLLVGSYIFTILSLYYSLSEIYSRDIQLTNIRQLIYTKNAIILMLSAWIIFIFNILLIIVSHMRIDMTIV